MSQKQPSIWTGVYDSFDKIPLSQSVFDADIWIKKQTARFLEKLKELSGGAPISDAAVSRDYPLSTMVALLVAQKETVTIVDYGGAMGQTYLDILSKVPDAPEKVNYIIIETKGLTDNLPAELDKFSNLSFVNSVEEISGKVDIVHIGSTLQYIEDWQELCRSLVEALKPGLVIFSDLLAGDIPTFATAQRYYEQVIPSLFININEFLDFWKTLPYRVIYQSHFHPLQNDEYYPVNDLPETHRLKKPCHVVFFRNA